MKIRKQGATDLLSRPSDSTPECWTHYLACLKAVGGPGRIHSLDDLSAAVGKMCLAGARHRDSNPAHGERTFIPVTTIEQLFCFVTSALDSADVPFMVVGSFASTFHGVPRATQDLDLVCDLHPGNLQSFLEIFSDPAFYFSPETARAAVETRGMFNLIHPASGWKIDIIVKKNRDFSQREFERRLTVELFGQQVGLASAEDTILSKLEWARTSHSSRQLRDVAEVMDAQGDRLDSEYLQQGVCELNLQDVYERVHGPW